MALLAPGSPSPAEIHDSGERVHDHGAGSLVCVGCGFGISIAAVDALPTCPACGGSQFRRASIFDQPTMDLGVVGVAGQRPRWLESLRASLSQHGFHVAWAEDEGEEPAVVALPEGWTRIGRSATAGVRLDDPTVSRRHALLVVTPDGELRAMDDRSLNGLFVNGRHVDWSPLADGDELEIGRYRLYVLAT